jgi:hypothetical protein
MSNLKSLVASNKARSVVKAPKHMLTVKQWAEKEGVAERTAYTMLTELCQEGGGFVAMKFPVKLFGGGFRIVLHYGPKK